MSLSIFCHIHRITFLFIYIYIIYTSQLKYLRANLKEVSEENHRMLHERLKYFEQDEEGKEMLKEIKRQNPTWFSTTILFSADAGGSKGRKSKTASLLPCYVTFGLLQVWLWVYTTSVTMSSITCCTQSTDVPQDTHPLHSG